MRTHAWSRRNSVTVVDFPFRRGERVSVFAAMGTSSFVAREMTRGTFSRKNVHSAFHEEIAPYLNPWPLPRSIVIHDNAKIHMYRELEDLVHSRGALLFFSPPYCPQLNPI